VTERLYYTDCYLREFQGRVVDCADNGRRVYLDRTAFYPTSGGQPFDTGTLGGARVIDVVEEGGRIAHILDRPLPAGETAGAVDWERRYGHMQQHTGQHLLSAVLQELYRIPTVSFHLGSEASTIDVDGWLTPEQMGNIELRCAEVVSEARPVRISFEESAAGLDLRKASAREGTLRIVTIEGLDRSACGGTHLRSTAEIGPVLLGRTEKVRSTLRLEFVCGQRALRRARADHAALAAIARVLSASAAKAASLVADLADRNKALEKERLRLACELARHEGRALYETAVPGADGLRRARQTGPIDDAMRARAQAFAAQPKALFVAICADPPSILVAASSDSGVHAGESLKTALARHGGRGGGSPSLAQGSVPSADALHAIAVRFGLD
jgi:alanyl-tRNA synthetase